LVSTLRVRYGIEHIPDEVLKTRVALSAKKFPAIIRPEKFIIVKRRINNQLDADKLRSIDVISSKYFEHHYANHEEYRSEPTDRL
jgi:hypothetical protein